MPFKEGNQYGKSNLGKRKETSKTIWLLQSLASNGVDLQDLLAKSILKASKGDRQAMDLAHLLTKLLPYLANMPKTDTGQLQIETLVINRYVAPQGSQPLLQEPVDVVAIEDAQPEGYPPLAENPPLNK